MSYKPQFGSKAREALYSREAFKAHLEGQGKFPICHHCNLPVTPDQDWDAAHIDVPRALGGNRVGVGHRRCNQEDNNKVVTPMAAKAREVWKRHVGIKGPGLGGNPMQCGRRSGLRKTMRGNVVPRQSLAEKHREFIARRYFVEVEDFSEPLEVTS